MRVPDDDAWLDVTSNEASPTNYTQPVTRILSYGRFCSVIRRVLLHNVVCVCLLTYFLFVDFINVYDARAQSSRTAPYSHQSLYLLYNRNTYVYIGKSFIYG